MQTVVVVLIVGLSAAYLVRLAVKSIRGQKGNHCSGCGKE